jgi:hypothetical protein
MNGRVTDTYYKFHDGRIGQFLSIRHSLITPTEIECVFVVYQLINGKVEGLSEWVPANDVDTLVEAEPYWIQVGDCYMFCDELNPPKEFSVTALSVNLASGNILVHKNNGTTNTADFLADNENVYLYENYRRYTGNTQPFAA